MVTSASPRTIACVEDDPSIRVILRAALEVVGGFRVSLYASGREAIAGLAVDPVDIIVLDVMMPEMDGRETFMALRELPSCRDALVMFLTAKGRGQDRAALLALGAAEVLLKPFDPMQLADQILAVWRQHRGATGSER